MLMSLTAKALIWDSTDSMGCLQIDPLPHAHMHSRAAICLRNYLPTEARKFEAFLYGHPRCLSIVPFEQEHRNIFIYYVDRGECATNPTSIAQSIFSQPPLLNPHQCMQLNCSIASNFRIMTDNDHLQAENSTLRNRIAHLELLLAQQSPAASQTALGDEVFAAPVPQPELHKAPEIHFNAANGLSTTAMVANTDKSHDSTVGGDETNDQPVNDHGKDSGGSVGGGVAQGGHGINGSDTPRWSSVPHGLTQQQIGRYSRQLMLPSFGVEGASMNPPCSDCSVYPTTSVLPQHDLQCHTHIQ